MIVKDKLTDEDRLVRCVESRRDCDDDIDDLREKIQMMMIEVSSAEEVLRIRQENLENLRKRLEAAESNDTKKQSSRSDVGKRWRIAGLKLRAGIGFVKRRDLSDLESFITPDSEVRFLQPSEYLKTSVNLQVACMEDQLDWEGKCGRKTRDKRYFRKTGVVTSCEGRGDAW